MGHGVGEDAMTLGNFPATSKLAAWSRSPASSTVPTGTASRMRRCSMRSVSPVRYFVHNDSMTMFIGRDETGTLVEVGVIEWHGVIAIAHAIRPARTKYLR